MTVVAGVVAASAVMDSVLKIMKQLNTAAPEIIAFYRLFRTNNPNLNLPEKSPLQILQLAGLQYDDNLANIAGEEARLLEKKAVDTNPPQA